MIWTILTNKSRNEKYHVCERLREVTLETLTRGLVIFLKFFKMTFQANFVVHSPPKFIPSTFHYCWLFENTGCPLWLIFIFERVFDNFRVIMDPMLRTFEQGLGSASLDDTFEFRWDISSIQCCRISELSWILPRDFCVIENLFLFKEKPWNNFGAPFKKINFKIPVFKHSSEKILPQLFLFVKRNGVPVK